MKKKTSPPLSWERHLPLCTIRITDVPSYTHFPSKDEMGLMDVNTSSSKIFEIQKFITIRMNALCIV